MKRIKMLINVYIYLNRKKRTHTFDPKQTCIRRGTRVKGGEFRRMRDKGRRRKREGNKTYLLMKKISPRYLN